MKHLILSENASRLERLLSQLSRQLPPADHAGVTVIWESAIQAETTIMSRLAANHPSVLFRELKLLARQFDTALILAGTEPITLLTDRCRFVEPYDPSFAASILQNNPGILSVRLDGAAEPGQTHEVGDGYAIWEIPPRSVPKVLPWGLDGVVMRAPEVMMLSTMGRHNIMAPCDSQGLHDHVAALFINNHPCLTGCPKLVASLTTPVIAVEGLE